jgi:transcriptional regulator with XRE-family HTH domain
MKKMKSRLKLLRDEQNLSQDALRRHGVPQSTLSRWENSGAPKQFGALIGVARAYGVSTDYLLGLTDDPSPPDAENQMLEMFDQLSQARKADLIGIADQWLLEESPEYRAQQWVQLEQMAAGIQDKETRMRALSVLRDILGELVQE